ncbi:alpha/beta fold hydrolase [Georgenia subflava]|uniref:Alpha/beta fold hydrolase n=1 Tax=Georgenia subflava TaxID=1622177 RepID=A0A6N7EPL8_9MICO|nr:alpha/beta hydrolase [Georgenia subflava]MPV37164.1 alpha/beta fold hydrolase [Georgenia subflava]
MTATEAHVVLVPGFWLGAWAWDDVVPHLQEKGVRTHPVTLPGLESAGDDRVGLTLDDHVAAVREVVAGLDGAVVLVGHSGAAAVVQSVVDADPTRIRRVVYVDSGPLADGAAIMPELPADVADLPLPTWAEFTERGESYEGIDETGLALFRERAVAHPAGVARSAVRLRDERRKDVPVTVVCCTIPAGVLRDAIDAGEPWAAELLGADVELVDMPTGHWPMFSRPFDLAEAILGAVRAR